jgi:4'-phosphopantetheinyl transferase EntD
VSAEPIDRRRDPSVDAALRSLVPAGVRVGSRLIDTADVASLHDVERQAVARAVAKRRNEFATGRALLRELLGWDGPIGVAASRAPLLPAGWRGSLAHDHRLAVAAVTADGAIGAVGIDVEPATPLPAEMADIILRADERELDAHLAFTLKEAAYKAWSSLGGGMLDHHDVRLQLAGGRFTATVLRSRTVLEGRFTPAGDRWVAVVLSPVAGAPAGTA